MSTVSLMTSLLTEDCSRFLPPQHRTLDHRLFEENEQAIALPRTQLESLQRSPGPSCIKGALYFQGKEGVGKEKNREKEKGI